MYLISAKGSENAGVRLSTVQKTCKIWASMKNAVHGLGVLSKDMFKFGLSEHF